MHFSLVCFCDILYTPVILTDHTLKILQSMSEFGGLWKHNMKGKKEKKIKACTIGWVAPLSQLAFHGESDWNFPWLKSQWDNKVVVFLQTFLCFPFFLSS